MKLKLKKLLVESYNIFNLVKISGSDTKPAILGKKAELKAE